MRSQVGLRKQHYKQILTSGGEGISAELFQILKDDAVKALTISANLENSAVATGLEKVTFSSNLKKSSKSKNFSLSLTHTQTHIYMYVCMNAKECSNYHTTALISHANKAMLKILQARLQQCMNRELPGVQNGVRKGRRARDQIANTHWIIKKASSKKSLILLY